MQKYINIFLSAFLMLCLSAFTILGEAEEYYQKGMESYQKQDYMQAIGDFTSAISLREDYAEAYYQRARAKDMLGKQAGFFSADMCFDLINAMKRGHQASLDMLRKKSNVQCHNAETMLIEPEVVFCADLSSHVLFKLPDYTDQLPYIAHLNLFDNRFSSMPDGILAFKYLVHLDMSSNALEHIHQEIGKLKWLAELNLNKNKITKIPSALCTLTQMRQLYLRHNNLIELPEAIGQMKALEELDLALNQLKSLPASITSLKNLKKLILVGNPIPASVIEELKVKMPQTEIFF
jgi:tetratricopeptide (TPR) repeat protein